MYVLNGRIACEVIYGYQSVKINIGIINIQFKYGYEGYM